MSRLIRGAALGTVILLSAAACTSAGAKEDRDDGPAVADEMDAGYGDLYYAVIDDDGDEYTSKLLRWDGTADGEVETVVESTDSRLFHTATVTGDGAFVAYAEGSRDGELKLRDLKTGDTEIFADFPKLGDSCLTPAFAPGDGHEVLVPGDGEVTIHDPEDSEVGESFPIAECMPQPAIAEGEEEPSIFYLDFDSDVSSGEIVFMKPDREVVDTDLGAKAAEFIGTETLHEIGAISPTGSQLCVEAFALGGDVDPYSRHANCQVLIDVATGEFIKHFDGEVFAVKYTGDSLMLRKDGELSYYPKADNLGKPAKTVTEPEELAEAQLIAVTDA